MLTPSKCVYRSEMQASDVTNGHRASTHMGNQNMQAAQHHRPSATHREESKADPAPKCRESHFPDITATKSATQSHR
jgi:hypothetical protein